MKYVKILVACILVIAFGFFYLYIPGKIVISGNDYFSGQAMNPQNGMTQIQYWDKWMPYKKIDGHSFIFNNSTLEVKEAFVSAAKSTLYMDGVNAPLTISALEAGKDSTYVRFECVINNYHISPLKRLHYYKTSKKMEAQIKIILQSAKQYYANQSKK